MHKTSKDKYLFSFVMPVYNVQGYLEETINSVLSQSISFEEHVEIILINDGSPDDSGQICERYQKMYPNNIKYIEQANQGVSVARNKGIELAEGKYISFLDSDDLLSRNTLENVYDFFEQHAKTIDIVSIKMRFFEAFEGDHMLNYKFGEDKVVNISEDYDYIQMSAASSFIKRAALKGRKFEVGMKFAEDARLVTEIIMDKGRYGVLSAPVYKYRKRLSENSALSSTANSKEWYEYTLSQFHDHLIKEFNDGANNLHKYVQYVLMYELQWRYKQSSQSVLSNSEAEAYRKHLCEILKLIDDDIILSQRFIPYGRKVIALNEKHGVDVESESEIKNGRLIFNETVLYDYREIEIPVCIDFLEIENNELIIEGKYEGPLHRGSGVVFNLNGAQIRTKTVKRPLQKLSFIGLREYTIDGYLASISISPSEVQEISCAIVGKGLNVPVPVKTTKFSKVCDEVKYSYKLEEDFLVTKIENVIRIRNKTVVLRILYELRYMLMLISSKKIRSFLYRVLYFTTKPFMRKDIWILSDRISAAGDNGEALFEYIGGNKIKTNPSVYFAISKQSPDYSRLGKYGKTVDFGSLRYKVLFLHSKNIISSHADDFMMNAFGAREHVLSDLYNFNFTFLQHGIIKDDLSSWLNRYNKNFQLFVTSAPAERDSILQGDYGYSPSEVILTGLPRYDRLTNYPKNTVMIAPTWRSGMAARTDETTGKRIYDKEFVKSDFFKFFSRLINDEQLVATLKDNKYRLQLYLHPSLSEQVVDFKSGPLPPLVEVLNPPFDYSRAFSHSKILLTDYSSVAFDFAYLRKPVLYAQFDKDEFFKTHLYKEGYFSYERDGFGPVLYNYKDTVAALIKVINANGELEKKYSKRINSFFEYNDRNNSKRVVEKILNLENH